MKKVILIVYSLIFLMPLEGQTSSFSDSTQISLITCSPGKEVYARFGHTAVRLNDPVNNIDIVFNYGIFDFNTKNFYLKFIKGETDYKLAAYDFRYFLPEYIERNSTVWEQNLNLTPAEKRKLIQLLLINYEPQNRTYRYNFVFDNCSTRPRDKIAESLNGRIHYKLALKDCTFRDLVQLYVGEETWLKLGIDIVFGDDADAAATRSQSMFLPEILMNEFEHADIVSIKDESDRRPLVSENIILNEKKPEENKELFVLFRPFAVSIFLLIIGLAFCYKDNKYHIFYKSFDTILYFTAGLLGCVVLYLSFFSLHPLVKNNINILWLNPLLIFTAFSQWFKSMRIVTFCVQAVNFLLLIAAFCLFTASAHYFNAAFMPLVLLLLVRTTNYLRIRLQKGIKKGIKNKTSSKTR